MTFSGGSELPKVLTIRGDVCQHTLHPRSLLHVSGFDKSSLIALSKALKGNADPISLTRETWLRGSHSQLGVSPERATLLLEIYSSVFCSHTPPTDVKEVNKYEFILFLYAHSFFSPPPSTTGLVVNAVWPEDTTETSPPSSPRRSDAMAVDSPMHSGSYSPHSPLGPHSSHHGAHSPRSHSLSSLPSFNQAHSPLSSHSAHVAQELMSWKVLDHYLHAVRESLPEIISLLDAASGDNSKTITVTQFDALRVFLEPHSGGFDKSQTPLHTLCPLFQGVTANQGVPTARLVEWLQSNVDHSFQAPEVILEGIVKSTVVRIGAELGDPRQIVLRNCKDAHLYLLGPTMFCHISGCSDCTIVLGVVAHVVTIEDCENCHIIGLTRTLRISNTQDSVFNFAVSTSPVLAGDNRGVSLGPYNTFYPSLPFHLEQAHLPLSHLQNQLWRSPLVLSSPTPGPEDGMSDPDAYVQSLDKFAIVSIPFRIDGPLQDVPIELPDEFKAVVRQRQERVDALRFEIRAVEADMDTQKQLQAVIQSHFKEWLHSSGSIRLVNDLIRYDQEVAGLNPSISPPSLINGNPPTLMSL